MPDVFCTGCQKYKPAEEMTRKRLKSGGVRIICKGCVARAKARSNNPDTKGKE